MFIKKLADNFGSLLLIRFDVLDTARIDVIKDKRTYNRISK